MDKKAFALVMLAVVIACRPDPVAEGPPPPPGATGPASPLLGSCCGHTDAMIMKQTALHESTPEANQTPEVAVVPYRTTSGIVKRERIVIEDSAAWAALWPRVVGSHSPRPPLPRVDFSREVIVIASMGQQSSGGFTITIDTATTMGDTLRLNITQRSPGPTCMTTAALSFPIALARVVRPKPPIQFIERTDVTDCG